MRRFFLTTFSFLMALSLQAKVELPSIFSDNMVLQQKQDVAVWGKASGKKLTITPGWTKKKTVVTPDQDGKWFVRIPTPEAGGPYEITFDDGQKLTLHNVLVGEVWFCGGQSNMEMPMKGFEAQPVENAAGPIMRAKASVPIRICSIPNQKAAAPLSECKGSWKENLPETVASTSAVAYFFALRMQEILEVPIGLLISDWGGSVIEAWMSREVIENQFPGEFDTSYLDGGDVKSRKNAETVCALYNAMVAPLVPFSFKGMIWYQGESNRRLPEQYTRLQVAYVQMMRDLFQNPEAPFYFVQIAPYPYGKYGDLFTSGYFYEAQQKAQAQIPHSGIVPTVDLGAANTIHPPKKQEIGDRLAYLALVNDYGRKGINPVAPTYKSVEFKGAEAIVSFDVDRLGLSPMKTAIGGFELAGEDRVFHPATATVDKNTVTVTSEEVSAPLAVRYCFRNWGEGTLWNSDGIPLLPFRTDAWDDLGE